MPTNNQAVYPMVHKMVNLLLAANYNHPRSSKGHL